MGTNRCSRSDKFFSFSFRIRFPIANILISWQHELISRISIWNLNFKFINVLYIERDSKWCCWSNSLQAKWQHQHLFHWFPKKIIKPSIQTPLPLRSHKLPFLDQVFDMSIPFAFFYPNCFLMNLVMCLNYLRTPFPKRFPIIILTRERSRMISLLIVTTWELRSPTFVSIVPCLKYLNNLTSMLKM